MVWNFMADTVTVSQQTIYFRPTSYAFGTITFIFYNDGFFNNIIREMYTFYDLVEYKSHSVKFTPPG